MTGGGGGATNCCTGVGAGVGGCRSGTPAKPTGRSSTISEAGAGSAASFVVVDEGSVDVDEAVDTELVDEVVLLVDEVVALVVGAVVDVEGEGKAGSCFACVGIMEPPTKKRTILVVAIFPQWCFRGERREIYADCE